MLYQAVVFDVGGVLIENAMAGLAETAQSMGIDVRLFASIAVGIGAYDGGDHPWHRLERGEIEVDVYNAETDAMARSHGLAGFPALPDFDAIIGPDRVTGGMLGFADEVRDMGLTTAILTNNVRPFQGWRALVDIDRFSVVVDSCEVGMRKPDPTIFELTAARLGVAPSACLFLDDMAENIAGAEATGMAAVHVTDPAAAIVAARGLLGG